MIPARLLEDDVVGLPGSDLWEVRHKSDPTANALADRHYSRRRPGSGQVGPPGRKLVLVTHDDTAVWLTHWPEDGLGLDGLDAWRCSIFRNEGPVLSSSLILAAMALTAGLWLDRPTDGWVTWIDTRRVRSPNPGYCFLVAGWHRDHDWRPARGRRGRIRLRAPVPGRERPPRTERIDPIRERVYEYIPDSREED